MAAPTPPAGARALPLLELLERYRRELHLRGYGHRTVRLYTGHIRRFLEWLGRAPRTSREDGSGAPGGHALEDAKGYLAHLLDHRRTSRSYLSQAVSAIKLLYRHVLALPAPELALPRPKNRRSLPVVLSVDEVARILGAVDNLKHKAILMTIYSAGLRVGEVVRLKVEDVDSRRGLIRVRKGKGGKDRYVMLSDITLEALRAYWLEDRPRTWLFPGARPGRHLGERSVQKVFSQAKEKAGIRKKVSTHSLRHAFATHLLEDGIDIRYIQTLLGHKSTKTTEIYTRVSRRALGSIRSPLDRLEDRGLLGEADEPDDQDD